MKRTVWAFRISFLASLFFVVSASAAFVSIEDFEGLDIGSINTQNGWVAASSTLVAVDPAEASNQVLSVTEASTLVRKSMLLVQGDERMMFLRFRFEKQLSGSFGLSHLSSPDEYSDFGPEINLTNSSTDLRIANGDTLGTYDDIADLDTGTWYNLWVLVDNLNNESEVWLNTEGDADSSDKLSNDVAEEVFGFRSGGVRDLVNFYIKTSSGGSGSFGPLYIDDIYLENSDQLNLANPVPEPATFLMIALGGLFVRKNLRTYSRSKVSE